MAESYQNDGAENTQYLVRLLLPATADLDFGKAAQKLIDKIESGRGTWDPKPKRELLERPLGIRMHGRDWKLTVL